MAYQKKDCCLNANPSTTRPDPRYPFPNELNEEGQVFDIYKAIDEQLLQKVLPKIHGNKKEIGTLLDELEKMCKEGSKPLEQSAGKIKQMKGKLATVQYTSFI